jgi:GT2 family glycosyltransferase
LVQISVIIPTYNRETFISRAIESVFAQTYKDYEIIVIDDGSTDQTRDKVSKYGDRVRYIYQQNLGPSAGRNVGILNARGKYIAFCDSDDCFFPEKLEKQMAYIQKHPDCPFLYTWYNQVNHNGEIEQIRKPTHCESHEHLQYCLFNRKFTIRTSTVLVEKGCFDQAGLFNERFWYSQDWDMWLRLAAFYKGACIKEPLAEYWLHGGNRSSHRIWINHPEIRESILRIYGWNEIEMALLEKRYGQEIYENDVPRS